MIEAYPQPDGTFALRDGYPYPKHGGTYTYRAQIKARGGQWNGNCWTVSETALGALKCLIPVTRMRRAVVAAVCHNPQEVCFVTEQDIARGTHKRGCSRCDRSESCGQFTAILEVLG